MSPTLSKLEVAVLGAGIMGASVARLLVSKGVGVRLHVRSSARARLVADLAQAHRETPRQTVEGADVILSCVSDDEASESVWFGPQGACSAIEKGTPCLEMSTLSTDQTESWILRLTDTGLVPIDCPVTGSKNGAMEGSLVAFVGSPRGASPTVETLLDLFTSSRIHFAASGEAMRFKLAYNTIGAGICAVFAEGLALMEASGLDMDTALSALEEGGWTAAIAKSKGRAMVRHSHDSVAFRAALMLKDLNYAARSFNSLNMHSAVGEAVRQLYHSTCEEGFGDRDFTVILEAVTKRIGVDQSFK